MTKEGKEFSPVVQEAYQKRQERFGKVIGQRRQLVGKLAEGVVESPLDKKYSGPDEVIQAIKTGEITWDDINQDEQSKKDRVQRISNLRDRVQSHLVQLHLKKDDTYTPQLYNAAEIYVRLEEESEDSDIDPNSRKGVIYESLKTTFEKTPSFRSAVKDIKDVIQPAEIADAEEEKEQEQTVPVPGILKAGTKKYELFEFISSGDEEAPVSLDEVLQHLYADEDHSDEKVRNAASTLVYYTNRLLREKNLGFSIQSKREDRQAYYWIEVDSTVAPDEISEVDYSQGENRFELPNGESVSGLASQLLKIASSGNKDRPVGIDQFLQEMYPDIKDRDQAIVRFQNVRRYIRETLENSGVSLIHVWPYQSESDEAGYYLKEGLVSERSQYNFYFPDGTKFSGKSARILGVISENAGKPVVIEDLMREVYPGVDDPTAAENVKGLLKHINSRLQERDYVVESVQIGDSVDVAKGYVIERSSRGLGRGRDTGRISGGSVEEEDRSEASESVADQAFNLFINSTPQESVAIRQLLDLGLTEKEMAEQRKRASIHLRQEGRKLFVAPDFRRDSNNKSYFAEPYRGTKIDIKIIERTAYVGNQIIELNEENAKVMGVLLHAQHPCTFLDYIGRIAYSEVDKESRKEKVKSSLQIIGDLLQTSTGIDDLMFFGKHPDQGEFVYLKETRRDYVPEKLPDERFVALDMIARNTSTKFEVLQEMGTNRGGKRFNGSQAYRALTNSYRDLRKRVFHSVATKEELDLYHRFEEHLKDGRNPTEMIRIKMGLKPRQAQ